MSWDDDKKNGDNTPKSPWGGGPWGEAPKNDNGGMNNRGNNNRGGENNNNDDFEKLIRQAQEKIQELFQKGRKNGGKPSGFGNVPANLFLFGVLGAIVVVFWLLSGIYTVNTKEEAVILRFGKYVRTAGPGLNYHMPAPFEEIIKLSVTDRYRTEVGYSSNSFYGRDKTTPSDIDGLLILTGDENLADVTFEVQWQIADSRKFIFNVMDPQKTIRDAAESAMREVIGTTPLTDILSEGRTKAQRDVKELLQSMLDSYDIGITVSEINMKGIPPRKQILVENITIDNDGTTKTETLRTTVDEAFKDVQAAKINKEEIINTAMAKSNEIIPQARGQAQRVLQEAQGYKERIIAKAEGEAKRFTSVFDEYKKAKDVTRKRIYLETMEEILAGMDKMVLDSKGGVVPYLPVNELKKRKAENNG